MTDHLSNKPLQVVTYPPSSNCSPMESPNPPPSIETPSGSIPTGATIQIPSSSQQRTLVLTSQQSAALTKHLMMQQQQQQQQQHTFSSYQPATTSQTLQQPLQPSSSAQFYSAAASHPTPHILEQRRHPQQQQQLSLDDYEDDEALVIYENPDDNDDDEDQDSSSRPPHPEAEPENKPSPNFLPQLVIQHPQSSSYRAHSPYPSTSTSAVVVSNQLTSSQPATVFGRLTYKDAVLYVSDNNITEIGRNSTTSTVHFHVGKNSFVSRKHLQLIHDTAARDFFLVCLSKNGVFVDDIFQRKTAQPLRLPRTCTFRFPSTVIRIIFESLYKENNNEIEEATDTIQTTITNTINNNNNNNNNNTISSSSSNPPMIFAPLKISIPLSMTNIPNIHIPLAAPQSQQKQQQQQQQPQQQQQSHHVSVVTNTANAMLSVIANNNSNISSGQDQSNNNNNRLKVKSPFPSPTGTISAANSCPASPRHHSSYQHHPDNYNIGYPTAAVRPRNLAVTDTFFQVPAVASTSSTVMASSTSTTSTSGQATASTSSSSNELEKPPYSYAQLIVQSISAAAEKQLTLSGIYSFITKNYQYYRKESNKGWQNSIRHNLSLNRYFIKVARSQDEPGKGSFWRIDPTSESKLIDQRYKKRRQRGSQCFRSTPYGMPRSAPVSPSHVSYAADSADSSPLLHDMIMQSAPGSPGGGVHAYHHHHHSLSSSVGEPEIIGHDYGSMVAPIASTSSESTGAAAAADYSNGFAMKRPAPPKAHNQRHLIAPQSVSHFNPQQSLRASHELQQQQQQQAHQFTNDNQVGQFRTSDSASQMGFYEDHQQMQQQHSQHHHHHHLDDGLEYETEEVEVGSTTTITTSSSMAVKDDGEIDYQYSQQQQQHQLHNTYKVDSYPSSPEPKRQRFSPDRKIEPEDSSSRLLSGVLRHTTPQQPLADH